MCERARLRACVCLRRSNTIQSNLKNLLLFSLSHLALFSLSLLPLFPHPPLLPCLLSEGTGKFYLHFFENVITLMMMTVVLMIIVVVVEIKGGVSERVSSSRGEETSAL